MKWLETLKEKLSKYKKNIALVIMTFFLMITMGNCEQRDKEDEKDNKLGIDYEQFIKNIPNLDEFINSLNIMGYNGDSLEEALKINGYPSSFPYRLAIASYFGIDDYVGTVEQDKNLIKLIKDNYEEKNKVPVIVPEITTPSITNPEIIMDTTPGEKEIDKPTKEPVKEQQPTEPGDKVIKHPNPTNRVHASHKFGEWTSINDEYEERTCSCGAKEQRKHKKDIKVVTVSNNNGTHTIVTTEKCVNCNYQKVTKIVKNCNFGNWTYDPSTGLDKRICSDCQYVETREHIHEMGKIIRFDNQHEYRTCICGHEFIFDHELDRGITNPDGSTTYKCIHEGCGFSKTIKHEESHTHRFVLVDWDSTNEYYKCLCGETKTGSHNLGGKVEQADGSLVNSCQNDGCGYEEVHIHTIKEEIVPVKSHSTCYEIVVSCDECGQLHSTKIDHDWVLIDEGRQTYTYGCTVCGLEKDVDKPKEEEPSVDPIIPPIEETPDENEEKEMAYRLIRK